MADERVIDWAGIEAEYRAGRPSLRAIGEKYGVAESTIRKYAKREGWSRDLSERIADRADAIVRKEAVRNTVRTDSATEKQIVEANADVQAAAILDQRKDVQKARATVRKLFAQSDMQIDGLDDLERLGELMCVPDDKGYDKLNELYRKIIDLPSRIDGAKKLSESLRILVELERKVLRIKDEDPVEKAADAFTAIVRKIIDPKNG